MSTRRKGFIARRWSILLVSALAILGLIAGCNPQSFYFLMPWKDDKQDAKFALTTKNKDVTVIVLAAFANRQQIPPECQTVDRELSEKVSQALKARYDANKEKLHVIPYSKVKNYLTKESANELASRRELGKHFKADYVINMEINSMSFYEGSYRQLFHGDTEIMLTVYDVKKDAEDGPVFEEVYHKEYPTQGPIDAGDSSVVAFRSVFLNVLAKDLSKYFAAYPTDERYQMDRSTP